MQMVKAALRPEAGFSTDPSRRAERSGVQRTIGESRSPLADDTGGTTSPGDTV